MQLILMGQQIKTAEKNITGKNLFLKKKVSYKQTE